MDENTEKQVDILPDAEQPLIPEDEGLSPASVPDAPTPSAEPPSSGDPSVDRVRLEYDVYQRHLTAIQEEIDEIRRQYQVPDAPQPDPVTVLFAQVGELKTGFDDLKKMLSENKQQPQQQAPQNFPQIQPMFPAPAYPYPVSPPMYQTSTIMPAPPLTYFSTPTLMPTNTQAPQIGQFNNNMNGGK